MMTQQKLSKRIKELCQERAISFYELSYRSAVPITTLMHIVNCSTKNTGINTIMKICDGFHISIRDFFDVDYFNNANEQ